MASNNEFDSGSEYESGYESDHYIDIDDFDFERFKFLSRTHKKEEQNFNLPRYWYDEIPDSWNDKETGKEAKSKDFRYNAKPLKVRVRNVKINKGGIPKFNSGGNVKHKSPDTKKRAHVFIGEHEDPKERSSGLLKLLKFLRKFDDFMNEEINVKKNKNGIITRLSKVERENETWPNGKKKYDYTDKPYTGYAYTRCVKPNMTEDNDEDDDISDKKTYQPYDRFKLKMRTHYYSDDELRLMNMTESDLDKLGLTIEDLEKVGKTEEDLESGNLTLTENDMEILGVSMDDDSAFTTLKPKERPDEAYVITQFINSKTRNEIDVHRVSEIEKIFGWNGTYDIVFSFTKIWMGSMRGFKECAVAMTLEQVNVVEVPPARGTGEKKKKKKKKRLNFFTNEVIDNTKTQKLDDTEFVNNEADAGQEDGAESGEAESDNEEAEVESDADEVEESDADESEEPEDEVEESEEPEAEESDEPEAEESEEPEVEESDDEPEESSHEESDAEESEEPEPEPEVKPKKKVKKKTKTKEKGKAKPKKKVKKVKKK